MNIVKYELRLHTPAEANKYGEEGEQHDGGVRDVRQEDGQLGHVQLSVVDQDEEEDETDEGRDEDQQTEEESLAGPDTVHPGVGHHLPGGDREPVQLVVSPEPANHPINFQLTIIKVFKWKVFI